MNEFHSYSFQTPVIVHPGSLSHKWIEQSHRWQQIKEIQDSHSKHILFTLYDKKNAHIWEAWTSQHLPFLLEKKCILISRILIDSSTSMDKNNPVLQVSKLVQLLKLSGLFRTLTALLSFYCATLEETQVQFSYIVFSMLRTFRIHSASFEQRA